MTLAQFQVFAAVVDAGSFTEAAKALGMSQSSVSQAIASLEAELGVSLLTRGREGVTLTEIGARLITHVREVLNRTERMRQEAAASVGLEIGRLRLGSFPSVFSRLLPGTIGAFRRRHPGITVVLLEGTDPEVRDWVLTGVVDVGLVTLPIEGVESIVIAQDDMRAIVPARHPRATQPAVRPAQLGREPFILAQGGCGPLIRAIFHAAGITPRVQFEFHDMATILAMVQEELGVTLVPTLALPLTPIEVRALPHDPPVQRPIGLVVRSRHAASSAVTALIHQARTWAKAHGYGRERVPPPSLCRIVGGARPLSAQLRDVHVRRATRGLAWRYHPRQITKVTRYPVPGRWPGVTYRPISVMGGAGTCWRLETLLKPSGSG